MMDFSDCYDYLCGTKDYKFFDIYYDYNYFENIFHDIYEQKKIYINSNLESTQDNSTLSQKSKTPTGVTNSAQNKNSLIGRKTKRSTAKKSVSHIKNITKKFEATRKKQQIHFDNYRKTVLKAPYDSYIKLLEKYSGISDFQKKIKFNLNNVFGGTEKNKKILKLSLREIICIKKENKVLLDTAKPINKNYFNYFLSRNYKFLLRKFYFKRKIFKIKGKKVLFGIFKNFQDKKKEKECYSSKEFKREKENVLKGFKGLKGRKRKCKIFKITKDHRKKGNKNKKEQFPNENESEEQEESLQINNNISPPNFNFLSNNSNYFQFDENKDNNENDTYESHRSRDSNNNLDSEDNSTPNIGEVDENNYRHNRNFLENSVYNTYFKRESLLKNELDLSEIIKNSH